MTVGDRIRKMRTERGLTQKQLGEICGINEVQIRKYEAGKVKPKNVNSKKIADALGVDPYVLITWESYPEERYKKWLESAPPIYKYLDSIGYTVEKESEPFILGAVSGTKGTGNVILKTKGGNSAILSGEEFNELQSAIKDVVETKFYKKVMQGHEQEKPPE